MSAAPSHLVQILLPKETGIGQPIGKDWFDGFLNELTEKFGGATSFLRAPGQGLWQRGSGTEKDSIAVVEVMAEELIVPTGNPCGRGWSGAFPGGNRHPGPGNQTTVTGDGMDELAILGTFAAVTTVLAASLVAANLNAGVTVAGLPPSLGWLTAG